jgi:hypothetical protein
VNKRSSLCKTFLTLACLTMFPAVSSAAETTSPTTRPLVRAFPGAVGYGATASGGRGGDVYHVTNLDDAGPGSFRDAVSKPNRTVVFEVSGKIHLKSIVDSASNLTIAGQTAPGDGIEIRDYEVSFSHESNIIVRHLRFRQGMTPSQQKKYTIGMAECSDVILDHCSIQWGRWDCIGMSKSKRITLQDCIIGQAIDPQRFGALVESDDVTFARNLWIHNQSRNPKAKGRIQYVNNVIYNWGNLGLAGGHSGAPHYLDAVNNYFLAGPNSSDRFTGDYTATDHVYQSGNVADLDKDGAPSARPATDADFADRKGAPTIVPQPTSSPLPFAYETLTADQALQHVLSNAGAYPERRDALDQKLIDEVKSFGKLGKIVRDPKELGIDSENKPATASNDADRDGMRNDWETANGLDPTNPQDGNADSDGDSYTNLEEYLNGTNPHAGD